MMYHIDNILHLLGLTKRFAWAKRVCDNYEYRVTGVKPNE